MKRIYAAVFFLIAAIALGVFSYKQIEKSCAEIDPLLTSVLENNKKDTQDKAVAASQDAEAVWEKKKVLFHVFLDHKTMNNVEMSLHKTVYYASLGDIENTRIYAEESREDFRHIADSVKPILSNIF